MWQDYVLFAVQILFCFTLVPMLFAKAKPPLSSSIPTGLGLLVMGGAYATLALWFAAVGSFAIGIQWLVLAYQRFTQKPD
jgi:hypothetical protein